MVKRVKTTKQSAAKKEFWLLPKSKRPEYLSRYKKLLIKENLTESFYCTTSYLNLNSCNNRKVVKRNNNYKTVCSEKGIHCRLNRAMSVKQRSNKLEFITVCTSYLRYHDMNILVLQFSIGLFFCTSVSVLILEYIHIQ